MRKYCVILSLLLVNSCGDFPDYQYSQSENYCVMSFPFAGGFIGRKYVGYFNIVSSLQYLDLDPEISIFVGEPSHLTLEVGSLINVQVGDKNFKPEFKKKHMNGELQYWGPAFTFNKEQSEAIYAALKDGYDITFSGRLEVGKHYETTVYNYFFESDAEVFNACVNRLLDEQDLQKLQQKSG
ncbi:hypothetical protein [Aliikangiella sp. IMCC44632]